MASRDASPHRNRLAVWACILLLGAASGGQDDPMNTFTDFDRLSRPDSPNHWLVAPADADQALHADDIAPVFDMPASRLAATWQQVVREQPRTQVIAVSADGLQVEAEQRSALFGFVDSISFRALPLDGERATFIAYSRSQVGYWDFTVNRRRLQAWVAALRGAGN